MIADQKQSKGQGWGYNPYRYNPYSYGYRPYRQPTYYYGTSRRFGNRTSHYGYDSSGRVYGGNTIHWGQGLGSQTYIYSY